MIAKITFLLIVIVMNFYSCSKKLDNKIESSPKGVYMGIYIEKLLNPQTLNEQAPAEFKVKFNTTKGSFITEVKREWAPKGVDRFYNLVKNGFYNDTAFFRVIKGFVAQFGINGNPKISEKWISATIEDEPVKISNTKGTISFATRGPNTRTTQLFINYVDNLRLDSMGFTPFAKIIEGMDVVEKLYSDYGEGEPYGKGPSQIKIQNEGNDYLRKNFSKLDYIITAEIIK
ncbi:MAG: peptidylprolyl isomerase [Elusimicrobiales bacterium]|nr:peptidylprolyl isomerase [Elusimicrobiales bacterium]